ncbi:MAG: hypothetical protein JWO25_229 [Alphaproteobacteria bacterium]|nr:hypothetical protein [Alphaproteobacteria bacterium]
MTKRPIPTAKRNSLAGLALTTVTGFAIAAAAAGAKAEVRREAAKEAVKPGVSGENLIALIDRSEAGDDKGLRAAQVLISDPGIRAVVDARLAASRLDLIGVRTAMAKATRFGVPEKLRAIAIATEAGAAFACGDYVLAAADSASWMALPEGTDPIHNSSDIQQMRAVAEQLASVPRQTLVQKRPGSAKTWRDKATLLRAGVLIEGRQQEVVIDTGANLSVITESTAQALGLRVTGGASVRSSSRTAVSVRLAIATRLDIAGSTFRDVAFLVMKDADLQLPLPGGYAIPAIIGFPVLKALGTVTFAPTALTTERRPRAATGEANIVASGSNLFVMTQVNGVQVPLHVDSGASSTTLGPRFAAEHRALVAGLARRTVRSAGAGGATEETAAALKDAEVSVGGVTRRLASVDVTPAIADGTGSYGALGQDVLGSASSYTIDFNEMSLVLEPQTGRRPVTSRRRGEAAGWLEVGLRCC